MSRQNTRILAWTITICLIALTASGVQWFRDHLADESTLTGWILLLSTFGLFLLSERKRKITHPWGPVAIWLQVHTYLGVYASVIFLMHIGWPVRGAFEILLASCFVFVACSGIVLAIYSRTVPKKLAAVARDYPLEQIPVFAAQVANQAHELAVQSASFGEGATLAEYYKRRLLPFFNEPRGSMYRMFPTGATKRRLLRELGDLDRYLASQGVACRIKLSQMVQNKDDLDFHSAMQVRLRFLFALHVAFTWSLAILIATHVILVYRFQGVM
ncbi:MAG: hypothetical protein KDB03_22970 [Planctomycetales bacterium]|nr:hypothetical protein [Planctomycetales bacterium]